MRLQPIVDRLKERGFVRVYGMLEFAALKDRPGTLPAHFVLRKSWSAGENKMAGIIDQRVAETFMVITVLNSAARRDELVDESVHTEEQRLVDALVGWTHPDANRACEAAAAQLLSVDGSTLGWAVDFRLWRHIRKEAQ